MTTRWIGIRSVHTVGGERKLSMRNYGTQITTFALNLIDAKLPKLFQPLFQTTKSHHVHTARKSFIASIYCSITFLPPGRFFHFMEDPIEKLHKLDNLTDAVYCHIWNYQFREECKEKQEATARHVEVCQQMEQVKQNCKHKFPPATITKRESKAKGAIAMKKYRRSERT
jgi:hypothetical protein